MPHVSGRVAALLREQDRDSERPRSYPFSIGSFFQSIFPRSELASHGSANANTIADEFWFFTLRTRSSQPGFVTNPMPETTTTYCFPSTA